MNDKRYAQRVREMLGRLGLPFPSPQEIFRGSHHDLLFLNSHGVVIRIGPLDVKDLVNPGIIQPLGWLEDRENMIGKTPLTVAIYPGIEQRAGCVEDQNHPRPRDVEDLFFYGTGQGAVDVCSVNNGVIRVLDEAGQETAVEVLLDPDNEFNRSSPSLAERRDASFQKHEKSSAVKSDVLFLVLQDVFNAVSGVQHWLRAFQVHQPLRNLFWSAFGNAADLTGTPDIAARSAFWDACARVTNCLETASLPVWRLQQQEDGTMTYIREEISTPVVLYRPWTGEEADRVIQPLRQTDAVRAAVRQAHAALSKKDAGVSSKKRQGIRALFEFF